MKIQMAPDILRAILVVAAVGAIALRAAARRPEPQAVPGTRPALAMVRADGGQSRPAAAVAAMDGTGHEMARPSAPRGRPTVTVDQAQHIFHELHAEGRNALCTVCDIQYASG